MRVELFGVARARAGKKEVEVDASTLSDAVRALAEVCPGLVPDVIDDDGVLTRPFVASRNGTEFIIDDEEELAEEDALLILGAHAGG